MALSIKNQQAEDLARSLARETGENLTEAIRKALSERLERVRAGSAHPTVIEGDELEEICNAYRQLPLLDPRSPEEILAYDSRGLP